MPKVWNEREKAMALVLSIGQKEQGKKNDNTDVQENLKNELRV